jgi:2-polyprenyl-3-methyl-5-hydroxy-6-metoxy-1,4-benzoquinol methylase
MEECGMKNVLGQEIFTSQQEKEAFYDKTYPNTIISREEFNTKYQNKGKDDYFLNVVLPFCKERNIETVLDVGADHGRYSAMFADTGAIVTAMEISPIRTKHLRDTLDFYGYEHIQTTCADIEAVELGYHDLIFCSDVIEHLENPFGTWAKIIEHSKYAYALIPKEDSWNWSPDHTVNFNDEKIIGLLQISCGIIHCSVVEFDSSNSWYAVLVKGAL